MDEAILTRWLSPPTAIRNPVVPEGAGGGRVKEVPEDFIVEELPAYAPSGEGTHRFIWVEKRDVSAPMLLRTVASRLGVPPNEIGAAGMKDRRAVTRQWLSVPDGAAPSAQADGAVGETGMITVLSEARHPHKLKTGHLTGNRFTIRLRGRAEADDGALEAVLHAIAERGFVNTFGPQRFSDGRLVEAALSALLAGRLIGRQRQRRLAVSALQSVVFNTWAAARVAGPGLATVLAGDVMEKRGSGGIFIAEDPDAETPRTIAGETIVTGPLPGSKRTRARGPAEDFERQVLSDLGVEPATFAPCGRLGRGTRRAALAFPQDVGAVRDEDGLVVSFTLPPGCYATVLLTALTGGDALGG